MCLLYLFTNKKLRTHFLCFSLLLLLLSSRRRRRRLRRRIPYSYDSSPLQFRLLLSLQQLTIISCIDAI
ncbi:hypothetical protein P8452_48651 [Trifolium repens]|nr:hypothetical protein P8452_48651 [Trifolium repens]